MGWRDWLGWRRSATLHPAPGAEPLRNEPLRAEPLRNEPLRAEPLRAEPLRAEPLRAEPLRAGPLRAEPHRPQLSAPRPREGLPRQGPPTAALAAEVRHLAKGAVSPGDRMFLSLLLRGLTNDGLPLPSVPDVVLRIQRVLDDREAEIDPLVRAIAREPAVAVKLVGVANSSLYGGTHPARGLKSAVMRIGFRETRNVVLAILARGRLFRVPGFEREAEELHRLALATSLATQLLARERGLDQDEAFFAGLVHDLGRTVLYALAAEVRRQTRGCLSPTAGAVTTVSAALHEELGALVAETWGAGPTLVAAIRFHHCPQRAPLAARPLAEALCTAADIARGISPAREIFADEPPPPPRPAPARVVERTRAQLLALERSLSPPAAAAHLS